MRAPDPPAVTSPAQWSSRKRRAGWIAEGIALAMVGLGPLALGAVHTGVVLGIAAGGAMALAVLTAGGHRLFTSWLGLVLCGITVYIALQLLPVPAPLLRLLSPQAADILDGSLRGLSAWPSFRPFTLDLPATARELARAAGWTAILVVLQTRAHTSPAARTRLLRAVILSGALVAVLGIMHLVLGAEVLLGFHRFNTPPPLLTTFGNPNHLGGFLTLCALLAFGAAAGAARWLERLALAAAAMACAAGVLLTESRGAILCLGGGLLVFAALRLIGATDEPRARIAGAVGVGLLAVSALTGLLLVEAPGFAAEMRTLTSSAARPLAKMEILRVAGRVATSFPAVGIGRGAFGTVHPIFLDAPPERTFTHVENEPLQAIAELGALFGLALTAAFAAALLGLLARGRRSSLEAGAAAGCLALAVQNLADFGLQFAAGLACLAILSGHTRRGVRAGITAGRAATAFAAVAVLAGGIAAWPGLDADTARLQALSETGTAQNVDRAARAALLRRPADWFPAAIAAQRFLRDRNGASPALPWINRALLLNPHAGLPHRFAGEALARLGRREQALLELRTAAELGEPTMAEVLRRFPDERSILAAAPARPPAAALQAADTLRQARRDAEALAVLRVALQHEPSHPALVDRAAELERDLDGPEAALALTQQAVRSSPGDPALWLAHARALDGAGRANEAEAAFRTGLELAPDYLELRLGLAQHLIAQGRPEAGLSALDVPVQEGADRVSVLAIRARARRAMNEPERARDELRSAIQRAPKRTDLRLLLCEVYLDLGKPAEADREAAALGELGEPIRERIRRARERARQSLGSPMPAPGAGSPPGH